MKGIIIVLIIIIVLFSLYKIDRVRYALVRAVWKFIDWISNKAAEKAVLPEGIKAEADVPYIVDGNLKQVLDVYFPKNTIDKLPVIIFTHGGGFVAGDKGQIKPYCMTLAKEGYLVFNINYRLAPDHKIAEQIKDIMYATSWIKEYCDRYCGDSSKVFLAGDSAGAYLTALIAGICTNEALAEELKLEPAFSEDNIKGVLLFCGLYDLRTGSKTGFPSIKSVIEMALGTKRIENYGTLDSLSVINNITNKFPRTFVSSGAVDWLHPESIKLINVLDKHQIYHKECLFDKKERRAMHDYQFHMNLEPSKECLRKVIEFLKSEVE
jgi:acetyl esterase/lipase